VTLIGLRFYLIPRLVGQQVVYLLVRELVSGLHKSAENSRKEESEKSEGRIMKQLAARN
jgi:hypothetical protein